MYELAIALGMFGGLLSYELIGFSPGGIVTPGYLALFIDQPIRILGTLVVSAATYGVVRLLSGFTILYGRRRFVITMLVSFLLRWGWGAFLMQVPVAVPELRVIGFIVPGLIANDLDRQGPLGTVSALVVVTTFVVLSAFVARSIGSGQ
jgi:gamma-polyglutamate biosynthesis protein CapC